MPAHKIRLAGPWEQLQPVHSGRQSPPENRDSLESSPSSQPASISDAVAAQRCQLPWRPQQALKSGTSDISGSNAIQTSVLAPAGSSSPTPASASSDTVTPESSDPHASAAVRLSRRFHRPNGLSVQTRVSIRLCFKFSWQTAQSLLQNSMLLSAGVNGHQIALEISEISANSETGLQDPSVAANPVTFEAFGQISDVLKPFNLLTISLDQLLLRDPHTVFEMAFLEIVEPW